MLASSDALRRRMLPLELRENAENAAEAMGDDDAGESGGDREFDTESRWLREESRETTADDDDAIEPKADTSDGSVWRVAVVDDEDDSELRDEGGGGAAGTMTE
jgi:hypothetical protein